MTWQQKLLAWLAVGALIGLAALYVSEFKHFGNMLDISDLLVKSLAIGLAVGGLLGWYLQKNTGWQESVVHLQRWTACLLFPLVLAPLLGSLTNRLLTFRPAEVRQVEFLEEKPYAASAYGFLEGEKITPDGWYLFVVLDGEIVRFQRKSQQFPRAKRGDMVGLELRKGAWGYEFLP